MLFFLLSVFLINSILYLYLTRNFRYWQTRGIKFIPPTPGFGNLGPIFRETISIGEQLHEFYKQYANEPYVGFFTMDSPALLIRDVNIIRSVLIKDFSFFSNRVFAPNVDHEPLLALNLFSLKGEAWRKLRSKLTPCFSTVKIKFMYSLIEECVRQMDQFLEKSTMEQKPLLIKQTMAKFTTDVISSCAFGIQGKALENTKDDVVYQIGKNMFTPNQIQSTTIKLAFFAPKIAKQLRFLQVNDEKTYQSCREIVWNTINYRQNNNIKRNDFLDILMSLRKEGILKETNINLEDADYLIAQAFVFLIAGYETSSTLISFACYELAKHPEIQNQLRNEIIANIEKNDGKVTYDTIKEMKYLEQVINETLRMHPPLPFLDRFCEKQYQIPGTKIMLEPGTKIYISLRGLHHDSKYYMNSEQFNPDNFSEENVFKRDKFTFMPFGEGPRYCIGTRFALIESKLALVTLLKKYKLEICSETPIPVKLSTRVVTTTSTVDIPLMIKKI